MIPRRRKFPLRTEFLKFRTRAKKTVTPLFTIYHLPSTIKSSRFAVIVPKKVSKLATTRNYLKRLTYDYLWQHYQNKKTDLVIVFKPLPLKRSLEIKNLILGELHV